MIVADRQDLAGRLSDVDDRFAQVDTPLDRLEVGQAEMRDVLTRIAATIGA
ncbi:hypothetical protein HNR23_003284 [Nocardiopsis mwathae]|uniref:Uncharacterized protein n=1 Tax=Nocardiopsis mwathae TaxID=1472723 RepID=A0A7X0D7P3_9ACTN|nr:hypothetical protein [Nocardiopsis mwathae]MBB6173224.1 hypothetical protein [Nocardiopsis mwathae]